MKTVFSYKINAFPSQGDNAAIELDIVDSSLGFAVSPKQGRNVVPLVIDIVQAGVLDYESLENPQHVIKVRDVTSRTS